MPPLSDDLKSHISTYISKWRTMSRFYTCVSILLRGSLIIASALVAAKLGIANFLSDITAATLEVWRSKPQKN
jgi:hypothetical protein